MEKDALSLQSRSPAINNACHVFAGQRLLRTELLSSVLTVLVARNAPVSGLARARVGLSQKKVMETREQSSRLVGALIGFVVLRKHLVESSAVLLIGNKTKGMTGTLSVLNKSVLQFIVDSWGSLKLNLRKEARPGPGQGLAHILCSWGTFRAKQ